MSRYYCPFCTSLYQYNKTRHDGVVICGQCGDPLIKRPLIDTKRILGICVTATFIAPLLIMIIFVIKDLTNEEFKNNSEALNMIKNDKKSII